MKHPNQDFLDEIEAFLRAHDMFATEFGLLSCKDGQFVRRLRMGMEPRSARIARVRTFMARYVKKQKEVKQRKRKRELIKWPRRAAA